LDGPAWIAFCKSIGAWAKGVLRAASAVRHDMYECCSLVGQRAKKEGASLSPPRFEGGGQGKDQEGSTTFTQQAPVNGTERYTE